MCTPVCQERVKEIQGVVKTVVPVFDGNEPGFLPDGAPANDADLLSELQSITVAGNAPLAGKSSQEIVAKFKALLEMEAKS